MNHFFAKTIEKLRQYTDAGGICLYCLYRGIGSYVFFISVEAIMIPAVLLSQNAWLRLVFG